MGAAAQGGGRRWFTAVGHRRRRRFDFLAFSESSRAKDQHFLPPLSLNRSGSGSKRGEKVAKLGFSPTRIGGGGGFPA
jgi:hypothetical protein